VTVPLPRTMQKLASKATCRGPFWGSIARGDSRTTTPAREIDPAVFMMGKSKRRVSYERHSVQRHSVSWITNVVEGGDVTWTIYSAYWDGC
jgi:hypothetical protein